MKFLYYGFPLDGVFFKKMHISVWGISAAVKKKKHETLRLGAGVDVGWGL